MVVKVAAGKPIHEGGKRRVSVIVPVRNDAAGIRTLLDALRAQTLARSDFEVVIGDDGSREPIDLTRTNDLAIRVLPGPPLNSYVARNRAVNEAVGDALAFCDSDCAPEPAWLEAGLRALERSDVAAGVVNLRGPARPTVWS